MHEADIILATGGPGMVHAAYSSGKPALGVGAGQHPGHHRRTADIKLAVSSIIHSKTFDNGMICASEQSVTVLDSIYDEVRAEFETAAATSSRGRAGSGAPHNFDQRRVEREDRRPEARHTIAALAGVDVPEETKILIGEVESVELSRSSLMRSSPRCWRCTRRRTLTRRLTRPKSWSATAATATPRPCTSIRRRRKKIMKHAERMEDLPHRHQHAERIGGIGDLYNFKMAPSLTLGCGSWGGNSVSGKRRREAPAQRQDRCREEREHALVPCAAEGVFQEGLHAGGARTSWAR